ncbi:50S ribosomal protein L18 [soil metagenome]
MNRLQKKATNLARRKHSIRAKIQGTKERPRLTIHISNLHVSAQLVDDEAQHTLATVTTVGQDTKIKGTQVERAAQIGTMIAKKASKLKIKTVVFDRNGKLYHGKVKALADAARAEGLEF